MGIFGSIIGRRIAAVVFVSIIVIEIIILIPSYLRQTDQLLAEMDRQGELLFESFAPAGHPDMESMSMHAETLYRSERIIGVSVVMDALTEELVLGSAPMVPFSDGGTNNIQRMYDSDGQYYDVYWPHTETVFHHGIALRFDASHIDEELRNYVLRISGLVLIIAAFTTLATMWILKHQILDSLLALRAGLLKGGGRDAIVPSQGMSRQDELGDLYLSVQTMINDLNKAHSDDKRDLQAFNEELERRVQARTEDLRDSQKRFREFAESASDWFWEMDENLRWTYFSDRFKEVTGVPPERLLGKTRQESGISVENEEIYREHLADLDAHRPFRNFEHPRTLADGQVVHLSISANPVFDEDGTFRGYRGSGKDVTDVKKADLAKSQFIATVSHELRTPLTSIKGALGLAQSEAFGEVPREIKSLLDTAYSNCNRLTSLTDDILDMEKIVSGSMVFQMEAIDIDTFLREAIDVNTGYGEVLGIRFIPGELAEGAHVQGDRSRLMQVMSNLMSNAAKASTKGESVTVSAARRGGHVRVSVTDTGCGIAEKDLDRIFEAFTQVDSSDTRHIPGTGLGLSISHAIVEQHGGTIGVESELDAGSSFYFTLPVQETLAENG